MIARHVFYEGRVQGVGFRANTKNIARGYEVTGWVKNLPDGRVEMQVCGDSGEVEEFLVAIAESDLKALIKKIEAHTIPAFKAHGFEIQR